MTTPIRIAITAAAVSLCGTALAAIAASQLPAIGAGALLYPTRSVSKRPAPAECVERTFAGVNARLSGWHCTTASPPAGTVVYLHGIGDNRDSFANGVTRFLERGFDVILYDSRGHGRSEGNGCTYGYLEKRDLTAVLDNARTASAILIGHSFGAAVALQAAAVDSRVRAVVAASTFSDLRSIATYRAPFVFVPSIIEATFQQVERDGKFPIDQVSPARAAADIRVPVLLIHGMLDTQIPLTHSERVYAALAGTKRLLLIRDAGHNDVMKADTWTQIETWFDDVVK
jgi:pimeloyl-ACP methyl ester carboxylesterase